MPESSVSFLAPLAAFIISFLASFAIFSKTETLSDKHIINIAISFLIAMFFTAGAESSQIISVLLPAFGILAVGLIFILALSGFVEAGEKFNKNLGLGFVLTLIAAFILVSFSFFLNLAENAYFSAASFPPILTNSVLFIAAGGAAGWVLLKK